MLSVDQDPCSLQQNVNVSLCFSFWSFDPEFICNASDNSGRYSYQAQPEICRWNLARLAEALNPDLPSDRAQAVLEEYTPLFNMFYLSNMRRKLGLLRKEEPEDEILITNLMQTMHNTGTKFKLLFQTDLNDLKLCIFRNKTFWTVFYTEWLSFVLCDFSGADFTNSFRCLSQISCPAEGEAVEGNEVVRQATELLLQQCSSLEELKAASKPTMDPR